MNEISNQDTNEVTDEIVDEHSELPDEVLEVDENQYDELGRLIVDFDLLMPTIIESVTKAVFAKIGVDDLQKSLEVVIAQKQRHIEQKDMLIKSLSGAGGVLDLTDRIRKSLV